MSEGCPYCDCRHDCTAEARERIAELEAERDWWDDAQRTTMDDLNVAITRAEKAEAEVERLRKELDEANCLCKVGWVNPECPAHGKEASP